MVDFRSTPYSSTRTYSSSGSTRTSGSSSSSSYSRNKKRQEAFSKPALGQAVPGALTAAEPGSYTGSVAFSQTPSRYPLVQRDGQTVALGASPSTKKVPELGMSEAFAQKYNQGMIEQNQLKDFQNFGELGTMQMAGFNPNQPFQPGFEGQPIDQMKDFQNFGQTPMQPQMSLYDQLNQKSYELINGVFDIIDYFGDGDFGRGVASLITGPLAGTTTMMTGRYNKALPVLWDGMPGKISKTATKTGGAKTWNTIKTAVTKALTKKDIIKYIDKNNKLSYKYGTVSRIKPWHVITAISTAGTLAMGATYLYLNGKQSKAIGTRDVKEEAKGFIATVARDFYRDGNREAGDIAMQMGKELSNVTISGMPGGKGTIQAADIYSDIFDEIADMQSTHYAEMEAMEAEGMTPEQTADFWEQYHARVEANKTAEENARVDHYNQQRRIAFDYELAARAAEREKEAAFWRKYKEELAKLEEEERKKAAEFWLEYKKMVLELEKQYASSGGGGGFSRSTLGFGLLR